MEPLIIETQILGLLIVAVFVATMARRGNIPYTVAMVLTGLGVGLLQISTNIVRIELEPELILKLFLPGLLFEAAYHLDYGKLRENLKTILLLAVPGVLLSMTVIAVLLNQLLGLSIQEALLFGVLISATDPVAVVALFKELGAPKRLSILMEGESLFNDGTAIVVYLILSELVSGGADDFTLVGAFASFLITVVGGVLLGLAAGLVFGEMMKRNQDHVLDIALTGILAYGTYLFAADVLHEAVSPVIAVVVAAVFVGNYHVEDNTSTLTIISFWEFVAFLINSAIFLLIGLTIELNALVDNGRPVLIGIVVILLARAIVVYPLRWAANKLFRPLPAEWSHVLFWGGLRGAVSIALVLSLPFALGSRQLMREMAFGYVLFALVIQALTMRLLLKRLRVSGRQHQREKYEMHRARMAIANAGVHAVEALHDANYLAGPYRLNLREYYLNILNDNADDLLSYLSIDPLLAQPDARYAQREIIRKQKETLMVLVRRGVISDEIAGELRQELDNQLSDADDPDWLPPSAAFWGTEDNRS